MLVGLDQTSPVPTVHTLCNLFQVITHRPPMCVAVPTASLLIASKSYYLTDAFAQLVWRVALLAIALLSQDV